MQQNREERKKPRSSLAGVAAGKENTMHSRVYSVPSSDFNQPPDRPVSNHLSKVMSARGWRVKDLARAMQVDPTTICRYRAAKRMPHYATALRLSILLDCAVADLFVPIVENPEG